MLLAQLAGISRKIAKTLRRLEKIDLIAGLLRQLAPEEMEIAAAYLAGGVRQKRIGIGYATLQNALVPAARAASLSLAEVDRTLDAIAQVQGAGSEQRKRELLSEIFARATEEEQDFLKRLLAGELRQGALEGIMIDALAKASGVPGERIRRAAMLAGGAVPLARPLLEQGEAGIAQFETQLFRPVQPMLAQTAEDIHDALAELGEAALEYKFDGARVQAHKSGDRVVIYSRRLNDVTPAIPEIAEAVCALPAKELILDGEVLSLDASGRPRPFQTTMRRFGRKLDIPALREEVPVQPFWFDVIYLEGGPLIDEPQQRRFAELERLAPQAAIVPHIGTSDAVRAEEFLRAALASGNEGVMAKAKNGAYMAGRRGQSWLKIKQARTLDLVVLAAEWGHGRRGGWLSNLHLGARDTADGGFAMLGKTFKGLTDEMLVWQTAELLKLEIARDPYTVYVEPKLVVEVAFNEIQVSPRYKSGLALRFARVKRYRPDKSADEADAFETVQKLAGAAQ
ncbi:MAG: ATP-dependent DNA ligase [Bryobacteraceae bacterium]